MNLLEELKQIVKGEVLSDPQTLNLYSHDTSLFEIKPQVVVFPKDSEDVEKLVNFVSEKKKDNPDISLTGRSGGTDMSGGAINDSIIMDFSKHFKRIGEVNRDGTEVEPGVFYRDFEKETLKKSLLMPSYPASRGICALGGMINNNAGGEKTLTHGKTIDYVNELQVILSDGKKYQLKKLNKEELMAKMDQNDFEGEIYRKVQKLAEENYDVIKAAKPHVSKNSTAYNIWDVWDRENFDLTKIFVGSQGTLGITTDINLRLIHYEKFSGLLVISLDDMGKLPHLINDIVATKPESFEVFDDHTMRLALQFMPQFIKILGLRGTIGMGFQFLPQLLTFLFKGLPKFTMLVEFEGDTEDEVVTKIENLKKQIDHYGLKINLAEKKSQADRYWVIRRESFNLLRKNVKDKHTAPFIDDFIIPPSKLIEFFPRLTKILEKYELIYTIAGHMGDGNFHIIPLMDLSIPSEKAKIEPCANEVYDLVIEFKGSISAEHNDGLIRGSFLKKMYGDKMFEIFKEIKDIFDPADIFNPHKKIDANLEYSLQHVRDHF